VFSNGIVFLAAAAIVTLLATGGEVSRLIPLYAIGVFTSFTLSQAGMTKHHMRLHEEGWRTGLVINAIGAILSFVVLVIIAWMKFTEGAWVIMLLVPIMVFGLVRLNKAYEREDVELRHDAANVAKVAAQAPVRTRHAVVVLVDELDAAAARAMQYARTLTPNDLRAVHFDLDGWKTDQLIESWQQLGLSRFPLDIIECPDRRIPRAALELAAELTADGRTELSVLIPRREYTKRWHRLLHDRSSGPIAAALGQLPQCSVTIVPYHLGEDGVAAEPEPAHVAAATSNDAARHMPAGRDVDVSILPDGRTPIDELRPRVRATVAGRVRAVRVQPWSGSPSLECTLADETGAITVVFYGRRSIAGIRTGTVMSVEGTAGIHHGILAILNPVYTLLAEPPVPHAPQH
jgi:hypothetical protein